LDAWRAPSATDEFRVVYLAANEWLVKGDGLLDPRYEELKMVRT
jgi:hypothetical protein